MSGRKPSSSTPHQPEGLPRRPASDDAWMMTAIGGLTESVNNLKASIERMDGNIQQLNQKVENINLKIYAASVIVGLLIVVGGFVIHEALDFAKDIYFRDKPLAEQSPANPPASNSQQQK